MLASEHVACTLTYLSHIDEIIYDRLYWPVGGEDNREYPSIHDLFRYARWKPPVLGMAAEAVSRWQQTLAD